MSYLDQSSRRHPATIAAVAALHLGIGYVIVTGLAYKVVAWTDPPIKATIVNDPPPPPPRHDLPPPRATHESRPVQVDTLVDRPPDTFTQTIDLYPVEPVKPVIDPPVATHEPPPPVTPSRARGAEPGAGRSSWVTSDDYPPQPLREGISGTVAISVAIGSDGRITACEVTKSSGNAQLDDATCRIYARRARFKSALDDEGRPTAARFTDRIRWELPQ